MERKVSKYNYRYTMTKQKLVIAISFENVIKSFNYHVPRSPSKGTRRIDLPGQLNNPLKNISI